jgi:hypothetical protein
MPRAALALAATLALAAGCGDEGERAVAHVGGTTITKKQLDETVEHFHEEAQREGKDFPEEGTREFTAARDRLLGLLVYRAELAEEAKRLGVEVSDEQVERRLRAGGGEEDERGDAFARESVRAQLLYERIYRRVTRAVRGHGAAATARRNRLASRFLARMQRTYARKVRYEPGYAPSS